MDYILLDLFLPESSGLETLERINQVKSKARLIVVTGLYDEKIAASVLEKGADFFVSKDHSDLNALVRVLRDYVEFQKKSN
jgi:CheY-like chemotaxis protein